MIQSCGSPTTQIPMTFKIIQTQLTRRGRIGNISTRTSLPIPPSLPQTFRLLHSAPCIFRNLPQISSFLLRFKIAHFPLPPPHFAFFLSDLSINGGFRSLTLRRRRRHAGIFKSYPRSKPQQAYFIAFARSLLLS